jgi:hypothetical protein
MGFVKVYKAEGHYEYNSDGVPLLGIVTERLAKDRVKFTMCNNATIEVDFKKLKNSNARCSGKRRDDGPWTTASKAIVPLIKAESGPTMTVIKFEGKNVDLSSLPLLEKDIISRAKAGDWVGYAFTSEDGKKSMAILKYPQ